MVYILFFGNNTLVEFKLLAWTTHTRPDISSAVALLAQVTEEHFHENPKKFMK